MIWTVLRASTITSIFFCTSVVVVDAGTVVVVVGFIVVVVPLTVVDVTVVGTIASLRVVVVVGFIVVVVFDVDEGEAAKVEVVVIETLLTGPCGTAVETGVDSVSSTANAKVDVVASIGEATGRFSF